MGVLLRCISVCCSSQGGKEIKNQGEMKDFASNLVRGGELVCLMSFSSTLGCDVSHGRPEAN